MLSLSKKRLGFRGATDQPVRMSGKLYQFGERLEVDAQDGNAVAEAMEFYYRGLLDADDVPEKADCEFLRNWDLRADDGQLCAIKAGEIVNLGRKLIQDLMRKKVIVPSPEGSFWCPYKKQNRSPFRDDHLPAEARKSPFATSWKNRHPIPGLKK
jgi:hypothetical protein